MVPIPIQATGQGCRIHQVTNRRVRLIQREHCLCLYTDDSIITGPDQDEINQVIKEIQEARLNITVEGTIKDFLGVNIEHQKDGTIEFTQPHLIDKVLSALRLDGKTVDSKDVPAASSKILKRHTDSPEFDNHFNYRSVISMLNYLEAGS